MIISGLHKFIFVAIPKTGTHAVRRALRAHMGPEDSEQVGLFVLKLPERDIAAADGLGYEFWCRSRILEDDVRLFASRDCNRFRC